MGTPNLNKLTGEPRSLCEEVAAIIDKEVASGSFSAVGLTAIVSKSFDAGYAQCEQDMGIRLTAPKRQYGTGRV